MDELENFDELIRVGHQMSNACFNLGQLPGEPLKERDAQVLRDLSRQWLEIVYPAQREVLSLESRAVPIFDPIHLGC